MMRSRVLEDPQHSRMIVVAWTGGLDPLYFTSTSLLVTRFRYYAFENFENTESDSENETTAAEIRMAVLVFVSRF